MGESRGRAISKVVKSMSEGVGVESEKGNEKGGREGG